MLPVRVAAFYVVHAAALREGRCAYFDTMNVQGERRDNLEQALAAGGFEVPHLELNRWYRRQLRETGIPHVFILGQPVIPCTGEYTYEDAKRERDTALLREITDEYRRRAAEAPPIAPEARVALVIYSTG
jgi:hypothetical protein